MTDRDLIVERVVDTANRWEEYDSVDDIDELDVRVTANLDGTARKFVVVVTTGGPHIEVDVTNETVTGYWGANTHKTHFDNEEYNFPIEDDLRRDSCGQKFEHMQNSEIEFVDVDRRVATEDGNVAVRIWFENGAHIRYELIDVYTVVEATYRPDDPSSVYDNVHLSLSRGGHVDFTACVTSCIREYLVSRRETVEDFNDWSSVYEVLR